MNEEFHVIASACETQFTVTVDGRLVEFSSLFAAARHARSASGRDRGFVVINDEYGRAMSRIPFGVAG